MFRPLVRSHRRPPRRGTAILITCFFLITIMMVTGLALVMYAAREKAAALAYQEAEAASARVAPAPEGTVNAFLSALIYDTSDDDAALQNSLRGHSIARGMYGSNPTGQTGWLGSNTPWAGVGLFHEDTGTYTASGTTTYGALTALADRRRSQFVVHTAVALNGMPFVLDPEWTGNRGAPAPNPNPNPLPGFAGSRAGKSYVGKHSGVVYPDLKSFFLAARDPHTGEVVQPSFHREWLFGTLAPSNTKWTTDEVGKLLTLRPRPQEHPLFPRVPPDADGVYRGDVQNLPGGYYCIPGAPGTAGRFIAKNDSLWMHIGLAPIRLADGRLVQPLVAPLVLPLDGGFDLAHQGNQINGGAHESYSGHGPWAINTTPGIAPAAPAERTALMAGRTASRNAEFNPFAIGQRLPAYSGVAWTGSQVNFQLPAINSNSMAGLPSSGDGTFTPAYGNFQNDNAQLAGHPAGYNSSEFFFRSAANPTGPVYPYTDLKRINGRYAYTPSWYNQAFAAQDAPMTFAPPKATSTYEFLPSPGVATVPATGNKSYRLDPAHTQRLLFSPRAMGLDRPALTPTFLNRADGTALALPALATTVPPPPVSATKPGALFVAGTPYPSALTQNTGEITDFAPPAAAGTGTVKQWYNAMAVLGSVNLNRPLADYRTDTTKPLVLLPLTDATKPVTHMDNAGNLNVDPASIALADKDRQALAKDIFARLIIATGAAAKVSFDATYGVQITLPDPHSTPDLYKIAGVTQVATVEQYNALRYLAQLAVNIVDHIDNDDVSTGFQWNPTNPTDLPTGRAGDIADAANRVVFGVEKPRLVINEMYGEITNDPVDPEVDPDTNNVNQPLMNKKAHVRFWAELLNPTHAPQTIGTGILGDGSVPLSAYQVQISRANRSTKYLPTSLPGDPAANAVNAVSYLTNNPANPKAVENVLGAFDPNAGRPDSTFSLADQPIMVKPNAGQFTPAAPLTDHGFVLLRTSLQATGGTSPQKALEFNPAGGVWANAIASPAPHEANSLGYTIPMPDKQELANPEFRQHVVLLRRLANPYLQFNATTNPYVTVDMMDYVPAFDAVIRANMDAERRTARPNPATMPPKTDGTEYDPTGLPETNKLLNRYSVGKVQPLAGFSFAVVPPQTTYDPTAFNQYTFGGTGAGVLNSMVLNQTVAAANNQPMHTFGVHNGAGTAPTTQPTTSTVTITAGMPAALGTQTLMLPFDWLPHLDRPLETAGDLFTVRDCKPYLLTSDFVHNTATGLAYESSYAQWTKHNGGLMRALELLTVKSPALGAPHGGRTGGRVNANVMQDRRVARGVWDPQSNNRFNQAFVDDTVWEKLIGSRTVIQDRYGADGSTPVRVPVPNYRLNGTTPQLAPTVLETIDASLGGDRAFQPYGGPAVAPPTAAYVGDFAYTNPRATGDGDTLLRADPATNVPYLSITTETHPYTRTEPLRKVMNNLTTVSHNFVVYLTIGYFDVKMLSPGDAGYPTGYPSNVNGGLFPQFGAEVYDQVPGDMRQKFMAVIDMSNMAMNLSQTSPAPASGQPFFTALTATVRPVFDTATPPAVNPNAPVTLTLASGSGNGSTYSIMADGQTVTVNVNDSLALGYGSDTQVVRVQSVGNTGPTVNQITVTGITRPVWGGTCVSNVRPGYLGPQGGFNYDSAAYKPVVPYVERLR